MRCACPTCLSLRREIVKRIDMWGIDMLFVVGGNGGNAGANAIQLMCQQNDVNCCVVGVPKSIDNDILLIDKCFGFDTAVEEAQRALLAAKVRALMTPALGIVLGSAPGSPRNISLRVSDARTHALRSSHYVLSVTLAQPLQLKQAVWSAQSVWG